MRRVYIRKPKDKKKPKKIFRKIFLLLLVVFSIWGLWDYTKPSKFPIRDVKVFATYEHVDQKTLKKIIAPYLKNGFFYLNFVGIKRSLLDLPWIYEISLRRQWPDALIVKVAEQKAVVQWGADILINSMGEIFAPDAATFPKDLPLLNGPKDKEIEFFDLYKESEVLFEPLDLTIKKMILTSRHYWQVVLSNDVVIYLKENDPLAQLELLTNLYRKITADRDAEPKYIDLRYSTGLAIKWD